LVAIVGCTDVLAIDAYSLLAGPEDVDLVLLGDGAETLKRDICRLLEEMPVSQGCLVRIGTTDDLAHTKIAILSSGVRSGDDDPVSRSIDRNVAEVNRGASILRSNGFAGIVLVAAEHAELSVKAAIEASGLDPARVIGLGLQRPASDAATDRRSLPISPWCMVTKGATVLCDMCEPDCPHFEEMLSLLPGSTDPSDFDFHNMAVCVMRICETILADSKAAFNVITLAGTEPNSPLSFGSATCIIGKDGVERVLHLRNKLNRLSPATTVPEHSQHCLSPKQNAARLFKTRSA
jgi:L-lactate dehydrogenase